MGDCRWNEFGSDSELVACFCEHGNELLRWMKCGRFLIGRASVPSVEGFCYRELLEKNYLPVYLLNITIEITDLVKERRGLL